MKPDVLPLWLAAGLYLWQAANYLAVDQRGLCIAFLAYAVANFGFILATRGF